MAIITYFLTTGRWMSYKLPHTHCLSSQLKASSATYTVIRKDMNIISSNYISADHVTSVS